MEKQIITKNGIRVAILHSDEPLITTPQSALDLIASTLYNDDCNCILLHKESLASEFFVLSSGFAGDVLQKFVNFSAKIAIVGDFSIYTSKPLKDFMYESNNGNTVFFVETEQDGLNKLTKHL